MASGIGMFGTTSKFYEETMGFKFEQLHKLRCDLVARAVDLGLVEGMKLGFDFHFKPFYGQEAEEKGIGMGPDKSGKMVPGFRPHLAWDLANNVIFNIAYFQGGVRSPRIIKEFCEQNVFSVINCLTVEEIYMDSEYTKEADFQYFKEISCKNGDVYICLKKNKQIKKLIKSTLESDKDWTEHNKNDERKTINEKRGICLSLSSLLAFRFDGDHIMLRLNLRIYVNNEINLITKFCFATTPRFSK